MAHAYHEPKGLDKLIPEPKHEQPEIMDGESGFEEEKWW